MATLKQKKPERALVTVDVGSEYLKLLDDCHRHVVALDYDGRGALGLKRWGMVTRSSIVRLAIAALYKQLNPTPASKARRK